MSKTSVPVTNKMPNVYVDRITYTEKGEMTILSCDFHLVDYRNALQRQWAMGKAVSRIKINMALYENKKSIEGISQGLINIPTITCVNVPAHKYIKTDQYGQWLKYGYNLKIKLSRKIGPDASLFFFSTMGNETSKSKNIKKPNKKGDYAAVMKKRTLTDLANEAARRQKKQTRTTRRSKRDRYGAIKHVPILKGGKRVSMLYKYYKKDSSGEWHGSVQYSKTAREFHGVLKGTKIRVPLERKRINNNVVIYNLPLKKIKNDNMGIFRVKHKRHKKNRLIKKLNSQFGKAYKYELDEQIDRQGNFHKYFILSLCNIALQKSKTARKIYRTNKSLFMEISNNLTVRTVVVERNKFKNLSRVKANKKSKYRKNRRKFNTRNNHNKNVVAKIDFRKPGIISGMLNKDDQFFKRRVLRRTGHLEIVNAGLPSELKTFYFVDNSLKQIGKGKVSYKTTISFNDGFYNYVKRCLREIVSFKNEILRIKKGLTKGKGYSNINKRVKGSYIEKYFKKHDIGPLSFGANKLKETPIVRGLVAVDKAALLLGIDREDIELDNKINLQTASMVTIKNALAHLDKISILLKKRYDVNITPRSGFGRRRGLRSLKKEKRKLIVQTFSLKAESRIKRDLVLYQYLDFDRNLKINKSAFDSRANSEIEKYFSGIPTITDIKSDNFTDEIKAKLLTIAENKHLYLTTNKIYKLDKTINSGVLDKRISISDFVDIKNIRIKTLKSKNRNTFRINSINNLPFAISKVKAVDEVGEVEVDPLKASLFLGDNSPFINKKLFKRRFLNLKGKKSIKKVSNNLVFDRATIKTISRYDFENDDNVLYNEIVDNKIDPTFIPLQIKSLIFNKSSAVKTNYFLNKDDIFSNPKTSEIAYQMYGNMMEVKYIDTFAKAKDGLYDLKNPIIKSMTGTNYLSLNGTNKLCIMHKYNNKMIPNKKDPFRSFGSNFLLIDTGEPLTLSTGKTTHNAKHHHKYKIDENGNGYTSIAVHPENRNIRHRHKIVNGVVLEAQSPCYPNCKDRYGSEGAPPHQHVIESKSYMSLIRTPMQIAERMMENTKQMNPENMPMSMPVPATQTSGTPTQTPASTPSSPAATPTMASSPTPMPTGGGSSGY